MSTHESHQVFSVYGQIRLADLGRQPLDVLDTSVSDAMRRYVVDISRFEWDLDSPVYQPPRTFENASLASSPPLEQMLSASTAVEQAVEAMSSQYSSSQLALLPTSNRAPV